MISYCIIDEQPCQLGVFSFRVHKKKAWHVVDDEADAVAAHRPPARHDRVFVVHIGALPARWEQHEWLGCGITHVVSSSDGKCALSRACLVVDEMPTLSI